MGGFASYPILADAQLPMCPFENPADTLAHLLVRRIYAVEFFPGRNSLATVAAYAQALRRAGIIITAGTDHNTPQLIPLAPAGPHGESLPAELQAIFY